MIDRRSLLTGLGAIIFGSACSGPFSSGSYNNVNSGIQTSVKYTPRPDPAKYQGKERDRELEEFLLRHGLDPQRNIAYLSLDIDRKAGFEVPELSYQILEEILQAANEKIKPYSAPLRKMQVINELKKNDFGFENDKSDLISIRTVLERIPRNVKKVDCDTGSLIFYLGVADFLDLPIKGVEAPRHFFVRWHFDKKKYINWETTSGISLNDYDYIKDYDIKKKNVDQRDYLRSMKRKEVVSLLLTNTGYSLDKERKFEKAIEFHNLALELMPDYLLATARKGLSLAGIGKDEEAVKIYDAFLKRIDNEYIKGKREISLMKLGKIPLPELKPYP